MDVNPIPLLGMMIPIIIVPTALWFKHARMLEEVKHAERMKAMELGLVPPTNGLSWPAASVCIAIGAGVPLGSFLIALIATLSADVPNEIWIAPAVVGSIGVVSAGRLACRLLGEASRVTSNLNSTAGKPAPHTEAYDFAGHR